MQKKKEILTLLRTHLDIPRELLPGGFSLSMAGDHELTVVGCRRILFYSGTEICLRIAKKNLSVKGKNLLCSAFGAGSITLTGKIDSLNFFDTPIDQKGCEN